ncbi:MAG TPA: serine/threonine-protein kinase [Chitinispirillaceae bacterium]|nr:serine/threonine-protein kinase [Chitinispirillaceae bacterium]
MIPKLPDGFSHPMPAGEGAFGTVYRVKQKYLGRWVALKIIPEKDSDKRKEYCKEARILAQISSLYVPQIYDAFEWKGNVCIVMQWIRGVSLNVLLENDILKSERILIASGLIEAIADLHRQGVAHRDLKPANIFWDPGKGIKLVDFGFSRAINDSVNSNNKIQGTPAFMAPELHSGKGAINMICADVYSAGMVLRAILDWCDAESFIARLLQVDPAKRLSGGDAVKNAWSDFSSDLIGGSVSFDKAEMYTTEKMSERLLNAARMLIGTKRFDEGYDLLLEAIDENPDNNEAVGLIARFSTLSRKSAKFFPLYMAAVIIVIAAIAVAYVIGRHTGKRSTLNLLSDEDVKVYLKNDGSIPSLPSVPVRQNDDKTGMLDGKIIVEVPEKNAHIFIDSSLYTTSNTIDVQVQSGIHEVQWKEPDGKTIYREVVTILPFQTKKIPLPPRKKMELP